MAYKYAGNIMGPKCFCCIMLFMADGPLTTLMLFFQRYGPPPSYPHLKIPGLNAPIPPGASFGYHPGGWGKPPVDEVYIFLFTVFSLSLSLSLFLNINAPPPPFYLIDQFT